MTPIKINNEPLYVKAYDYLLQQIQQGQYNTGDKLPSESELAKEMGISRITLREAIRLLVDEGIITRRQGIGSFINQNILVETGLEKLESILTNASKKGMKTKVDGLNISIIQANKVLTRALSINENTQLTRVRRSIILENEPVAYMDDYVLTNYLKPTDIDSSFTGSVIDLIRNNMGISLRLIEAHITAVNAEKFLEDHLKIKSGTALLLIIETLLTNDGERIGYSENYFRPGKLDFRIIRT